MGRKKQVRPHRSLGILERQASEAQSNEENEIKPEKEEGTDSDEHFYVETDQLSSDSEEHYDVSEVVLSNLSVSKEFYGYTLNKGFYADSRHLLRFKLSNVNEHLGRMKLGHWPILSSSSICLQFVEKYMIEGLERDSLIVSGTFDGPDEGVTGLVHLASLKLLTIRPILEVTFSESMSSIRLRVEIMKSMFDECESLLDNTRQLWKKSMMSVMAWLRPEVMTSEARYRYTAAAHVDVDVFMDPEIDSSASRKCARFDISSFYEAVKPSKEAPMLEDDLPDLLPDLRPYQRRAAYWMVQREKGAHEYIVESEKSQTGSPLCVPLNLINTSRKFYYNPFSGNVSLHPNHSPYVSGGILADEMGLGKTVELLACIFAHRMSSSVVADCSYKPQVEGGQKNHFKRLKRERVECVCGAVTESYRYKGLWVQCDICDAWQHADCVGYSMKRKNSNSRNVTEEGCEEYIKGDLRKHAKRKNKIKIVETDGDYICQICSKLIQATESPVAAVIQILVHCKPVFMKELSIIPFLMNV